MVYPQQKQEMGRYASHLQGLVGGAGPGQVIGGRGGHWWAGGGTCHWWAGPRAGRGRSLVGGTEGEAGEQTLVGGGGAGRTGHLWAGPRAGLAGGRLLVGGAGPAPRGARARKQVSVARAET